MSNSTFTKPLALIGAAVLLIFYSTGTSAQVVAERLVGPLGVVVGDVLAKHTLEVTLPEQDDAT